MHAYYSSLLEISVIYWSIKFYDYDLSTSFFKTLSIPFSFIQTYRSQNLPSPLLNAISFKHYVTNTYPNNSAYSKQKRNIDPFDDFSQGDRPRKFGQHYVKDYSRSNNHGYSSRPKPKQMNREYDSENFKDAEQVESSGKASEYGTTETQDFSIYNLPAELA